MITARRLLLLVGTVFGTWEAVDIFRIDVPAVAAIFSALFLTGVVWFWRRNTRPPVGLLMFLCAFEAAVAPSLKHTSTSTKAIIIVLGSAGFLSGVGVLWSRRRAAREQAVTA